MAKPIEELLEMIVRENAADLHINVGLPPMMRQHEGLVKMDSEPLTPEDTVNYMKAITSREHQEELQRVGGTDFGFAFKDIARFRVSVFKERGHIAMALRLIPYKFLTFEQLGLEERTMKYLLTRPRGLLLVTGPTGSGKTTTLASMIDYMNANMDRHIITIEDPIEYYHFHKRSIVTQRELGVDVPSFAEALRRGLRQDPDVFLVGELRDLETIEAAITAAETGHVVFGTLHTTGSTRTIDRMVNVFPVAQQEQIRVMLSVSILAIISQLLLNRVDKPGRIAAFEIMIVTPSIQNLIRERKTYRILSDIQTGMKMGMITLDAYLMRLFREGKISFETVMIYSQDPEQVKLQLAAEGLIDEKLASKKYGESLDIEDEQKVK
ncbi:MAG TPA: type IV pilus twitching motility protein PilT [Candidatus Ratteibacteria bacterium]|jgi:twitching motility protein PilT|uniref:Twitching mobility protein n=1 Tax=candidate division TA06 bacterium ADurb.Bin131 TaxID=1852827 RepID=A0A1V6CDI9_UNCT6|nr:MAG: Twitching mobility protein [candidate division TA06 bacterium ADurb.Bin131]HOC02885.1 type IV pilus twitching motility protein PilT [bacterium]HRS05662.1 type IV pilus twitching motility protein PilT [Candidatus Ratteibacteria bacterium]HON04936.1 type IV pilus twitching motility protein PilT [bacterium]HPC28776.1 type IV pilus twitching motility protein PilT [bacterium]